MVLGQAISWQEPYRIYRLWDSMRIACLVKHEGRRCNEKSGVDVFRG